jgi:hypothetical protein
MNNIVTPRKTSSDVRRVEDALDGAVWTGAPERTTVCGVTAMAIACGC